MTTVVRRLFLIATPLSLAVVLWFHPPGGENVYEGGRDDVGAWLFVHTVFLFFTPLLAIQRCSAPADRVGREGQRGTASRSLCGAARRRAGRGSAPALARP